MPKVKLIILAAIAVFAVISAAVVVKNDSPLGALSSVSGKFLAGVSKKTPEIASIAIMKKGNWISVASTASGWVLVDRNNYPVEEQKIGKLLLGAANLEIIESKTNDATRFDVIGVDDAEGAESRATRIIFATAGGAEIIADFVQGDVKRSGNTEASGELYARITNDNQAYLVKGDFDVQLGSDYFIEPSVLNVVQKRIHQVVIKHPITAGTIDDIKTAQSEDVKIYRAVGMNDFSLSASKTEKNKVMLNEIADTLENRMTFMDVRPTETMVFPEDAVVTAEFQTFDQLNVAVSIAKIDGSYWAKFKASSTKPAFKEVKKINDRVDSWVYKLSDKTAEGLTKKLSDLVREDG